MDVIGKEILASAKTKHTAAKRPIETWLQLMEGCLAAHPQELKNTFGSIDVVSPQTVFDIGGNKWRLIAEIDYQLQTVVVTHFLTHKEYDTNKWKRNK
jgi:mRNA interferase HigB